MIHALGDRAPEFQGAGHFVADSASIIGSVRLEDRASIWFNCVLRGDNDWLVVGERSNIQDGAVLHTDPGFELKIGNGVTVGHKAVLHGCKIGNNSLIGIGSTILNGARIGNNCLVGAHALVTENKEFPDGSLILGAPAQSVRKLREEEIQHIRWSADIYVRNAARFNSDLGPGV
ncbi:MAG: gamma carbonic anhydrase family protein [Gammaproteobacteria bacterium]|jgi:carbonic anhydrase/acetyltransferase-like protein (isoleucine patch superfamily)|nr:gamma carbonic anhydrase family protein [Gammaproteobacteria bacterium]